MQDTILRFSNYYCRHFYPFHSQIDCLWANNIAMLCLRLVLYNRAPFTTLVSHTICNLFIVASAREDLVVWCAMPSRMPFLEREVVSAAKARHLPSRTFESFHSSHSRYFCCPLLSNIKTIMISSQSSQYSQASCSQSSSSLPRRRSSGSSTVRGLFVPTPDHANHQPHLADGFELDSHDGHAALTFESPLPSDGDEGMEDIPLLSPLCTTSR